MEAALYGPQGRIALSAAPLKIGRAPDNQLVLADVKASTHHAEIRPDGQGYVIVDMGSRNGTFVNGERLEHHQPRLLRAGDSILIGDTRMSYEARAEEMPPTVYVGNESEFQPTVAAPPPGPQGYQPYQQVPPPFYPPQQPGPYNAPYPNYGPALSPAQLQKRSHRGLWIALSIVGIVIVLVGILAYANRSTPTKTLTTFCNDIVNHNFSDAYQQLSSSFQSRLSETTFDSEMQQVTTASGGIRSCMVGNVVDDGTNGSGIVTWAANATSQPVISSLHLLNENGNWKISSGVIFKGQ